MKHRPPEYLAELIDLVRSGIPLYKAAEIVGRAPSTCHEVLMAYAPDTPRIKRARVTSAERREFLSRFQAGESINSMSIETGREWRTIGRALIASLDGDEELEPIRCGECGALYTTHYCVRCSVVGDLER